LVEVGTRVGGIGFVVTLVNVAVAEQLQLEQTSPGLEVTTGSDPTRHSAAMQGFSKHGEGGWVMTGGFVVVGVGLGGGVPVAQPQMGHPHAGTVDVG
jgi:hypothetical protein